MSAHEPSAADAVPRLSMGELLASCAAASAVSTPPDDEFADVGADAETGAGTDADAAAPAGGPAEERDAA